MPLGPIKPYQASILKPGNTSAMAGTLGRALARLALVTPKALSLPPWVSWMEAVMPPKIRGTWPAITSLTPWPKPL